MAPLKLVPIICSSNVGALVQVNGEIGRAVLGMGYLKVSPSCSSLVTPDIFKVLGPYESSGYPLPYGVW